MNNTSILRLPEVSATTGKGRSTLYSEMAERLFVRPIKLSRRAVGWPANEITALNAARIAGKSDVEIRQLVSDLEAQRKLAA